MNFSSSSSSPSQGTQRPPQTLLHRMAPQILSKTPTILSNMKIPNESIKKRPKQIRSLEISPPSAQGFWESAFGLQKKTTDLERLTKTAKFMQNDKILTNLSMTLNTITPFDLTYGLFRLQYLQNVSTLHIKIDSDHHLASPSNLKMLYHALAGLKNLRRFSVELPKLSKVSFELLDSICFALRRIPSLAHFSIKFDSSWALGDLQIKRLALHLKKLSKLKTLALNFHKCPAITNIGLQPLSEALKNLSLLSDLSIHLISTQGCSSATFHDLFSSLATLEALKRLDISLKPSYDIDLKSIEPLSLGLNLLNPLSLHEITLKLYQEFSDYGMSQFSKSLARFSSLKTLNIEFPEDPSISNEGLLQFSSALQNLTSLSTLTLKSLHSCQASQSPTLVPQHLGFQRAPFGFPDLSSRGDQLSRPIDLISQGIASLTSLKNLSLDFACCFGEKSTTMQTFSGSLQNLKSLTKLKLRLAVCRFIEDEDIALLSQGLKNLKDLTHLEIDVRHIQVLTNQAVLTLIASFSHLPKLNHLTLKLEMNKTDDDLSKILAEGLRNLPALFSLDLSFSYVDESSYSEGVGVLCDTLKNLASLRKINLELKWTNAIEEPVRELERIKHVTITWR